MTRWLIWPLLMLLIACSTGPPASEDIPMVSVSILPQKYFVEQIAGDLVNVNVMIPPGASPATYEPSVSQLRDLQNSDLYFKMGYLGFELSWMEKIRSVNGQMKIIDLSGGIELIGGHDHDHGQKGENHRGEGGSIDPHTWLSPGNVKIISKNMYMALAELLPDQTETLSENLEAFTGRVDSLDKFISSELGTLRGRKFMIYHPSLSYFARDYDLEQFPLEMEGKTPSSAHMKYLADMAKKEHIDILFLQMQFDQHNASVLARETGARIIQINPLDPEWYDQMVYITEQLKTGKNE